MLAVRPQPQPPVRTVLEQPQRQGSAGAAPTRSGVYGQLGTRAGHLVGDVQVGVAHQALVVEREEMPHPCVAAAGEVEQYVLRQRSHTVGRLDRLDQRPYLPDVIGGEPVAHEQTGRHPADATGRSRSAAVRVAAGRWPVRRVLRESMWGRPTVRPGNRSGADRARQRRRNGSVVGR